MKPFFWLLLLPAVSLAQDAQFAGRVELMGSLSYTHSEFATLNVPFDPSHLKSHTITVTPSMGYFLSDNVELLFDLRYEYYFYKVGDLYSSDEYERHLPGLALGLSYNLDLDSPFFPFLGIKYGITWPRQADYFFTGWAKTQVTFPNIFAGTRILIFEDWSLVLILDYSRTNFDKRIAFQFGDREERMQVALGFSVIL